MRNTFIRELLSVAKVDKRVVLLTGDLGYGVIDEFQRTIPEQLINFGINEQSMMSAAAGLAKTGFKPYVYSIGNFSTFRCIEQIRNDVAFMNLDVTIVALGAGFSYGTAGYSHHLVEDISAMTAFSNIKTFCPADPQETKLAFTLMSALNGPKYLRLGKGGESNLTGTFIQSRAGVSELIGDLEFAIVTSGNILEEAVKLRSLFVESAPTLLSFYDFSEIPRYFENHAFKRIITIEEHLLRGGFGSLVAETLEAQNLKFTRFGISKIDSQTSGSQQFLRKHYGLTAEEIFSCLS